MKRMRWLSVGVVDIFALCALCACGATSGDPSGSNAGNEQGQGFFVPPPASGGGGGAPSVPGWDGSAPSPGTADVWKPRHDGTVGVGDPLDGGACGYGTVYGVVCSKSDQMYVNGASIWIDATDCEGNPVMPSAVSDGAGFFTLENVPSGLQTVVVEKGDFTHSYTVLVVGGKLTDITSVGHKECFKAIGGDCPVGSVTGYVCAPNETLYIGGASVWVETSDCKGKPLKIGAVSDESGNYELNDVPAGVVIVQIQKGSFETSYEVTVPEGGAVHASDVVQDACFGSDETKIAVITGDWDEIEAILTELGLEYDLYDGDSNQSEAEAFLADGAKMKEYDIIFFDCGGDHDEILFSAEPLIVGNLQQFVAGGGSVYASDWAFVYVEWPWPSAIDFVGGDKNSFGAKLGMPGTIQGSVTDPALAAFLGKSLVSINYDLAAWVAVQGAPATTEVHLTGDVPLVGNGVPLMLSHSPGAGKVLYTTFHNEKQVTGDMIQILKFLVFQL